MVRVLRKAGIESHLRRNPSIYVDARKNVEAVRDGGWEGVKNNTNYKRESPGLTVSRS